MKETEGQSLTAGGKWSSIAQKGKVNGGMTGKR